MTHFKLSTLLIALCTFACSCAASNEVIDTPISDKPSIELRLCNVTNTSGEVEVTLANAAVAYCVLCNEGAATPSTLEMMKG